MHVMLHCGVHRFTSHFSENPQAVAQNECTYHTSPEFRYRSRWQGLLVLFPLRYYFTTLCKKLKPRISQVVSGPMACYVGYTSVVPWLVKDRVANIALNLSTPKSRSESTIDNLVRKFYTSRCLCD